MTFEKELLSCHILDVLKLPQTDVRVWNSGRTFGAFFTGSCRARSSVPHPRLSATSRHGKIIANDDFLLSFFKKYVILWEDSSTILLPWEDQFEQKGTDR